MEKKVRIVRCEDVEPRRKAEHEPYEYLKRNIVGRGDCEDCTVSVYELPPGKANYPMHWHEAVTEVFYILEGEGTVETPDGAHKAVAGQFVVMPPCAEGAHRLVNTSDAPLRYIDFSTRAVPDIVHYTASGKTGVMSQYGTAFFRDSEGVGYYDGE